MTINPFRLYLNVFLVTCILQIFVLLAFYNINGQKYFAELLLGYFSSFLIFSSGFLSICWALKRSLKVFMGVVIGGIFAKFVLIGIVLFLLMRYSTINIFYFLITFVVFYLIYQVYEFRFINAKMGKRKK